MKPDKKIEVPITRDEINNALLESEIYKVAYQRGVEDGVRGFVGYVRENGHSKSKYAEPISKTEVEELVETYLQSLKDGGIKSDETPDRGLKWEGTIGGDPNNPFPLKDKE